MATPNITQHIKTTDQHQQRPTTRTTPQSLPIPGERVIILYLEVLRGPKVRPKGQKDPLKSPGAQVFSPRGDPDIDLAILFTPRRCREPEGPPSWTARRSRPSPLGPLGTLGTLGTLGPWTVR